MRLFRRTSIFPGSISWRHSSIVFLIRAWVPRPFFSLPRESTAVIRPAKENIMEIGIIGLPQSGKSTLFEIMTSIKSRDLHGEACVRGQATVPDERFDLLVEIFHPLK